MFKTPKILVAAPQADVKNYCFEEWLRNIRQFSYPQSQIDIFLADNSHTTENIDYIKSMGVKCVHIPKKGRGIIEVMAECHQACLDYAKENDYDYLLHLETDIFPKHNILEELMTYKKAVVCGLYSIFDGAYREPMLRLIEKFNAGYMRAYGISGSVALYIDGKLLKVFSGALGCTLINKEVFDKIKFRSVENEHQFPDTWFANDMYAQGIPIYVSTKSQCKHFNKSWGTYNINFN
tara:strand:- start:968 stop:1675 length:708 start_codon:yes stop_codon:yes gene_type:complete